jgi:ATP-dependent helicase HrpB
MLLRAADGNSAAPAAEIAALLEEREIIAHPAGSDIDVRTRLDALASGTGADPAVRLRIRTEARRLLGLVRNTRTGSARLSPGALLSLAFPERVARRRPGSAGRFLTAGGTGVQVRETSPLAREEFLVFAEFATAGVEARAVLACPITREEILETFDDALITDDRIFWDEQAEAVVARRVTRLGAISLAEQELPVSGPDVRVKMLEAVRSLGLSALPWTEAAAGFRARTEWIRRSGCGGTDWPDLSDGRLLATLEEWLGPFMEGTTRRTHLERLNLVKVLRSRLSPDQLRALDRLAPETIAVPTGSHIRLDYATSPGPVLAVRLQEMFGATATPAVGGGKHPVIIHLLSPAGRPLAVTQDLASFWRNAYPQVRKEMRGRYPRHHWPEDPLAALPTRRVKPRGE